MIDMTEDAGAAARDAYTEVEKAWLTGEGSPLTLCPYCKTPVYFKHYAAPFLPKPHSAIDDSLHVRCIESRVWAQNHGDSAPEDGDVLPHENEDLSTGRGVGRSAAMQEQDCEGSLEGDGDQGG